MYVCIYGCPWCRFVCLRYICVCVCVYLWESWQRLLHASELISHHGIVLLRTSPCPSDLRRKHWNSLDKNRFMCPASQSTARISFLFKFRFFWIVHPQCTVWQFAARLTGIPPLQFAVQLSDAGFRLHRAVTYWLPHTAVVCLKLWTKDGVCSYVISPWRAIASVTTDL